MKIKRIINSFSLIRYQKCYFENETIFLRKNHKAYLDISINGEPKGRLQFELFFNYAPKTSFNFYNLCKGFLNKDGKEISFKKTEFHKAIPGMLVQGGRISHDNSESFYGNKFGDENFVVSHEVPGILSMANDGINTNGSQFFITTSDCSWFDGKHVAFGRLIDGVNILNLIEAEGKVDGNLKSKIEIIDCGVIDEVEEEHHDEHHHEHDHHDEHHHEHDHHKHDIHKSHHH